MISKAAMTMTISIGGKGKNKIIGGKGKDKIKGGDGR